MPPTTVRLAGTEDLPRLLSLGICAWSVYRPLLSAHAWTELHASISNPETYGLLLQTATGLLVEDDSGALLGMAFLVPGGSQHEVYPASWAFIRFISVLPEAAGRGIGRQLVEQCIELAKTSGAPAVGLTTSEIMPAAQHIYGTLGFRVVKEIAPKFGKRYWLYRLDL